MNRINFSHPNQVLMQAEKMTAAQMKEATKTKKLVVLEADLVEQLTMFKNVMRLLTGEKMTMQKAIELNLAYAMRKFITYRGGIYIPIDYKTSNFRVLPNQADLWQDWIKPKSEIDYEDRFWNAYFFAVEFTEEYSDELEPWRQNLDKDDFKGMSH